MTSTGDLATRYRASGLTQKAFCDQDSVSISALRYHLYRKRKPAGAALQSTSFVSLPVRSTSCLTGTVVVIRGTFEPTAIAELVNACER
jgi:hypothetical protein